MERPKPRRRVRQIERGGTICSEWIAVESIRWVRPAPGQSDGAPLLGPEHRQVGQALDAKPARKATLHRGFRQDGEMNARDSVIRIERSLLPSRMAGDWMVGLGRIGVRRASGERRAVL